MNTLSSDIFNYVHWADEYEKNASNIQTAIDKRKQRLKNEKLTADLKKTLQDEIIALQKIRREQIDYSVRIRKYARTTV